MPYHGPRVNPKTSGDFPPRRDRHLADDLVAARRDEAVDHVDDDADVVRHDADDVADLRPVVALRQVEEAVLLGKPCDLGLRMLEDEAVALEAAGVARQCLRAGVDNAALRAGPAD